MYIIKTKNLNTIRKFKFLKESTESVPGIYQNKELEIKKNDIIKINKVSVGKTVAVIMPPIIVIIALSNINTNTSGNFSIPWR